MRRVLVCAAVLFGPALAAAQTQIPDIGIHMGQSRDAVNVQSGCNIKWNVDTWQFECGSGGASSVLAVTLAGGLATTVTDSSVTTSSVVSCGCEAGGTATVPSCDGPGSWVARIRVASVSSGSFEIAHSWALGGEQIACRVN